jgi:chemotaxis protein CheD
MNSALALDRSPPRVMPPTIPKFAHVNRYWDPKNDRYAAKILPGEYYVTTENEMIVTILGSCVAVCVRNRESGLGGMNHFLLPEGGESATSGIDNAATYGCYAMELLINEILKHGSRRSQLEVKVFGGGKMLSIMTDHGANNVAFVQDYLQKEGLTVIGGDVGGRYSRKIRFFPDTGRVQVRRISSTRNQTLQTREADYMKQVTRKPAAGSVELF